MDAILGRNKKTVCLDLEDICRQDMMPFGRELRNTAVKRPHLGLKSYKIGQCEVQLNDAGAYNSHMRDIHGVRTEVQEGGYPSNLYPGLNNPSPSSPNDGGVDSILSIDQNAGKSRKKRGRRRN